MQRQTTDMPTLSMFCLRVFFALLRDEEGPPGEKLILQELIPISKATRLV